MGWDTVRLRIAVYQLGSCSGCINEFLSIGEMLLEMISRNDAELLSPMISQLDSKIEGCDISLVEGVVLSKDDVERLREIREKSKILIALGSCAILGGIPGLRRFIQNGGMKASPITMYVDADYYVRGCPIDRYELLDLIGRILKGEWFKQEERRFTIVRGSIVDIEGAILRLDGGKCIVCGRCIAVCRRITSALDYAYRSIDTAVSTPFNVKLDESTCIACGQCTIYCPVGAIVEVDSTRRIKDILGRGVKPTVYIEPEAIVGLCEALNVNGGSYGKILEAFRRMGCGRIILWKPKLRIAARRGSVELIPYSEAEARYIRIRHPDLLGYMANPPILDDRDSIWITPCLARKISGGNIVTVREAARLLAQVDIDSLPEADFDEVELGGIDKEVVKAVGVEGMERIIERMKNGEARGDVVLYVCPDGCLYGGGQPYMEPYTKIKRGEIIAQIRDKIEALE
jgi:coenzyme F420-reducing hydrogenase gamma subunit